VEWHIGCVRLLIATSQEEPRRPTPFHLVWFTNFARGDWLKPVSQGTGSSDGKFFLDMAQAMERICFDYITLEDADGVGGLWRHVGSEAELCAAGAEA
jgi:hypothetical protein